MTAGPPAALVRALVDGPSLVSGLEWHDRVTSTNVLAAAAAQRGAPEVHLVVADEQTAGRGRRDRGWQAPAGSSLLVSFLLRPDRHGAVAPATLPLLPLVAGLALAEAAGPHCPGAELTLKWPNDLLADGRKAAGILAEALPDGAVVVGVGVNVDWRGAARPAELAAATSLAEAAGVDVDRWRLLAALAGVLGNRYLDWLRDPAAVLDAYRRRCATLGRPVRVEREAAPVLTGRAAAVAEDGCLVVAAGDGTSVAVSAGDVVHVRPDDGQPPSSGSVHTSATDGS